MTKTFTAQEMRQRADEEERHWHDHVTAAMLRQAADDALEREEKYEYTVKYEDGVISRLHYDCVEPLEHGRNENQRLVRRSVGEWEEVKDVE